MSRRRVTGDERHRVVPVDLDVIQDCLPSPQDGFDGWCAQQDRQWDTEMARAQCR
jgi:hypothetical protein